ncbi:MAG: SH3 domain-containing protein [Clostridia bacterium]|nr:SH3 domain-containing protein [Clostridia bacterium]
MSRKKIPLLAKLLSNRAFFVSVVAVALIAVLFIGLELGGCFPKERSYSGPERAIVDGLGQGTELLEEPAIDAEVVCKLKTGAVVLIEEERGEWLYVTVRKSGESGWCRTADVKREDK